MQIHRTAVDVIVHTPAKLNLFFEVLAKRSDGYHEIETLMCPVDWFDTLRFRSSSSREPALGELELDCQCGASAVLPGQGGFGDVPRDASNLVLRAVDLIRCRTNTARGAKLWLIKRIPTAAGLGGGSSDAAAALVAANLGWNLGLAQPELAALAAELGSDVPFFLAGGAALCRGRGERITPVTGLGTLDFVVVRPPEGLSTASVYGACRPAEVPRAVGPLVDALRRGDAQAAGQTIFNRLQEPAERLSPWIAKLRRLFEAESCLGHGMSGSGTAYYGLFHHAGQARRAARRLQASGAGCVATVRSCR